MGVAEPSLFLNGNGSSCVYSLENCIVGSTKPKLGETKNVPNFITQVVNYSNFIKLTF